MAEEDKLINVIVKYSQEGHEEVSKTSVELSKSEIKAWQTSNQEAVNLAEIRYKAWQNSQEKIQKASDDTVKKDSENLQKMKDAYNKLTEDQLKAFTKLKPAGGVPGGVIPPGSSTPHLDPAGPRKYNDELQETSRHYSELKSSGRELNQIANGLGMAGGLMTAVLVANANNYVRTVGQINEYSAKWLGYEEDIKKANLEIGETATRAMLPTMKMTAELMQKVADIATANPWLVQGVLTAGSVMLAISGTMKVVAEIMKVSSDIGKLITKATEMIAAATAAKMNSMGGVGSAEYLPGGTTAGIGSMAMMAGTILAGIIAGATVYNKIKPEGADDAGTIVAKMTALTVTKWAGAAEDLGIAAEGAEARTFNWMKSILGLNAAEEAAIAKTEMITQQETQTYIAYQKQMKDASDNYGQQRADTIEEYEKQIADTTARYESQRAEAVDSFNRQMERSAQDFTRGQNRNLENYNNQVEKFQQNNREESLKADQEFQRQSQRQKQAHSLDMQRMEQQHDARLLDLAASRDALGIVKENQSYAIARSQKEQDFRIAEQERRADFQRQQAERRSQAAQQLAEMQANFENQKKIAEEERAIQVARQLEDQKRRLDKMDADHKLEMQKLAEQEKEKLNKLKEAYDKQVTQIQTAFVDRLRALDSTILGDTEAFTRHLQEQAADFQRWLSEFKTQQQAGQVVNPNVIIGTGTGRQYGGYARFSGPGETGREEFVMSGDTTRMAESLLGSRLNQANLMASLMSNRAAGGSGNRNMEIHVQSRNLTLTEIKSQIDSSLNQKLGDLLPAFGV